MVATMSKLLHVSRKALHKYTKFRVKIDENDETSCCALICRESYKERMEEGIKEDDIPISEFMDKFQSHIYKYIKHSHRSRWQALEFKHSCEVFEPCTILSVVEFAEDYTFYP